MTRRLRLICIAAVLIGTLGALTFNGDLRRLFGERSIDNLPTGDLMGSYRSPDNLYTVKTYLCNGGATVDFAVRAAVSYNQIWYRWPRNIYWQYRCRDANVTWIDSKTVSINGKLLNVERDAYDYRLH